MAGPIKLSGGGSSTWGAPVSVPADLPAAGLLGEVRSVLDDGDGNPAVYSWTGILWTKVADPDSSGLSIPVTVDKGGTGALTAAAARTNLDVPQNFTGVHHAIGNPANLQTLVDNLDATERPDLDILNVPSAIYVDVSGNDTNPGTIAAPLATINRAIQMVPINTRVTRTINIGAGDYSIDGRVLQQMGRLTIAGATPIVLETRTVTGVGTSSRANGLTLTVSGLNMVIDEHVGKLIKFAGGALNGKHGIVYANTATTLSVTQELYGAYVTAGITSIDLLSLPTRFTNLTDGGTLIVESSVSVTFKYIDWAMPAKTILFNDTDQVTLRYCSANVKTFLSGRGGSSNIRCSYIANQGNGFQDRGMISARTQGILSITAGTVIDGINAAAAVAHIDISAFGFLEGAGEVVFRDLGNFGVQLRSSYAAWRLDTINTDSEIRFVDCLQGFRVNPNGEGAGGSIDLPDCFGNILNGFFVQGARSAFVKFGPLTNVLTPGVLNGTGVNDVSADDGLSLSTTNSDQTYIQGGTIVPPNQTRYLQILFEAAGFYQPSLQVGGRRRNNTNSPWTIVNVTIHREIPGTAGSTTIDLNIDGVTAYTNQLNRPTILFSAGLDAESSGAALPDVLTVPVGSYLSLDIDTVEAGAPQNATIVVTLSY